MSTPWSSGNWNFGSWNDSAGGAVISGQNVTTSLGNTSVFAELRTGWGRQTWSSFEWNTGPDAFVTITGDESITASGNLNLIADSNSFITGENLNSDSGNFLVTGNSLSNITGEEITISVNDIVIGEGTSATISGQQLSVNLNAGLGWSRDEWSEGAWNEDLTGIVSGSGVVFIEDGQEVTSTLNNVSVTASAPINIITSDGTTFSAEGTTSLSTDQAKFGDASVEFDGTSNQGVQQETSSGFASGNFTSEFWIYSSSIRSQSSTLWDFRISGSGLLLTNNNGQISFFKDGSGGSSPTSILTNDTWHHIAIVRTGSTGNVYVDGNLQITRSIGTDDYSNNTLLLGNNVFNSSGYLSGYIDELRNSNVVRYSSNFTPPSSAFTPDANTIDLLHFDGTDGSTTIINSQDITQPVQGTFSIGEETVTGTASLTITGEELLSATVNTFAVAAGGAITINTPTFEANVELNNDGIVVGLASFLDITGLPLSANLGIVTTTSENIIPITGEELTTTANTITISAEQILSITGNGVTITLADIVPNSENFISIQGNRANANVSTLKFWDPIRGNITETWTNIH